MSLGTCIVETELIADRKSFLSASTPSTRALFSAPSQRLGASYLSASFAI